MTQQRSHLDWWQLKLVVPLMVGLIVLDEKYLAFSPLAHQLMLIVSVFMVYGLLAYGLYVRQTAIMNEPDQAGVWLDTAMADEIDEDESISATDDTTVPSTIPMASIDMQTKRGVSSHTWLN